MTYRRQVHCPTSDLNHYAGTGQPVVVLPLRDVSWLLTCTSWWGSSWYRASRAPAWSGRRSNCMPRLPPHYRTHSDPSPCLQSCCFQFLATKPTGNITITCYYYMEIHAIHNKSHVLHTHIFFFVLQYFMFTWVRALRFHPSQVTLTSSYIWLFLPNLKIAFYLSICMISYCENVHSSTQLIMAVYLPLYNFLSFLM